MKQLLLSIMVFLVIGVGVIASTKTTDLSESATAPGEMQISVNIDGRVHYCGETNHPPAKEWRCVPNCERRRSNGTCRSYAEDFCGFNAGCSPYCEVRRPDGTCRTYGSDQCRADQDQADK